LGVTANVRSALLDLADRYSGYSVVVIGHGMAAGIAGMVALIWLSDTELSRRIQFHVYALAPPLIFAETFGAFLCPFVTSIIFGDDFVSHYSKETLNSLAKIVEHL
jgi:hypothetical protein